MKRLVASAIGCLLATSAVAVCEVSDVTMSQGKRSRKATVSYRLTGDVASVVTVSICTNSTTGACLDPADYALEGDVNKRVPATGANETRTVGITFARSVRTGILPEGASAVVKAWALDNPPPVLVADPAGTPDDVRFYSSLAELPGGIAAEQYKKSRIVLVRLPAKGASYVMGSPSTQTQRGDDETLHRVTFAEDFYLGVYPVTMEQYKGWMNAYPRSQWTAIAEFPVMPVFGVSYEMLRGAAPTIDWPKTGHAVASGSVLGALRTKTGVAFDLPTEAQWEFACRAGTTDPTYNGSNNQSDKVLAIARANNYSHSENNPHGRNRYPWEVGGLLANSFGLYDMNGNCLEWCLDWHEPYGEAAEVSPKGPSTGTSRVMRGGDYVTVYQQCTSSKRTAVAPSATGTAGAYQDSYGFRLACPVDYLVKGE